jgi:hypothetical protein
MRRFVMTVTALAAFRAMVATAQAETPSPGQVPSEEFHYSDWATSANYHKLFIAMVRQQRYPRVVEGRVFNGIVLYHAAFEPYPGPGCPGRNVFSTFSVIMASPLSALLKRMISFFEPDIELYINNLSNYVEGNTFKSLGSKLGQRFNRTK